MCMMYNFKKTLFCTLFALMFFCIPTEKKADNYQYTAANYQQKYTSRVNRQLRSIMSQDVYTDYLLLVCWQECVDPLEMLSILQVENPNHNPKAINENWVKTKDPKTKKVKWVLDSKDEGLFQLNSKCRSDFEWFFWQRFGETEVFNPFNYEHNTRVAVRLHKNNKKHSKDLYHTVAAYNAGLARSKSGSLPLKTKDVYIPKFFEYYKTMTSIN